MGTLFQHFDNSMIQTNENLQSQQSNSNLPETDFTDNAKQTGTTDGEYLKPEKQLPNIFNIALQNIGAICLLIWFIVAVGLMIRKVTVYQSFVKYIRAGRIEISDMQLWERMGKLVEQTGIKGPVGLYTNSLISSPLLIGFFWPCIMIPDIKCTMDVNVLYGNFSYALPENCTDKISVTAKDGGVDFTSQNQYKNSTISLIATNKDFIKYEPPVYPSYFTKTNTGFEYANGTGENQISIKLTGYTSVNFLETPTNVNQSNVTDTEGTQKTVLEMEMNANCSSSDPFENGRLFCVSEDIETLNPEVYFQMDGESGIVEIKDRNADEVLWSNTWDENVSRNTVTVSLSNLQKEKEYVVRFTGTKIKNAVVKVTFESELVQEKSRPSK